VQPIVYREVTSSHGRENESIAFRLKLKWNLDLRCWPWVSRLRAQSWWRLAAPMLRW
jgi:hypothetical protein